MDVTVSSSSSSASINEREWSALSDDILRLIVDRLFTVASDYLSFSAVCRSWRSISGKGNYPPSCSLPWLLLPRLEEDDEKSTSSIHIRRFYSPTDGTTRELPIPEKTRCIASTSGFLVLVSDDVNIIMMNPISHVWIGLPPLSTFPSFQDHHRTSSTRFVYKVCLSKDKRVAMAIGGPRDELALTFPASHRHDDNDGSTWSKVEGEEELWPCHDVIYYKGEFHAVGQAGCVVACDAQLPVKLKKVAPPPEKKYEWCRRYLVESGSGDLLQVVRDIKCDAQCRPTTRGFEVLVWEPRLKEWQEVRSLEGQSLFLGSSSSISLPASSTYGCRPNCIYFADDVHTSSGGDTGIYRLGDHSIRTQYYPAADSPMACLPHWFQPRLGS